MEYDAALEKHLGRWGPYHWRTLATFLTLGSPTAVILVESVFQAASPPFTCRDPGPGDPATDDQCQVPVSNFSQANSTGSSNFTSCKAWDFDTDMYGRTVVTQWSLVCSQSWVTGAAQSATMAGLMTGVFLAGLASDRFGRRPVCLGCLVLCALVRIAAIFSPNYVCFIATNLLMSALIIGFFTPAYVACLESVTPRHRLLFAISMQSVFGITIAIMAGMAYLIKDWVYLTIAYYIFILPFFAYFKLLNESPRWLLSKGRESEARVIFEKMVESNGKTLPEDVKLKVPTNRSSADYRLIDLCRSPLLLLYLVINIYIWNVDVLLYYSLTLNSVTLFGDLYLNSAVLGLVELVAYPAAHVLANSRLARRGTQTLFFLLAGATVIGAHFVPSGYQWLRLCFYIVSKVAISIAFCVTYVFTPELFPTSLRTRALGICSQLGRLSSIFGPFIARLNNIWAPFPAVLIGSTAVVAGGLTLLLPETRGRNLPQTIEDTARLRRSIHPLSDDDGKTEPMMENPISDIKL